ncbi:hypothetical protein GCT13_43160 [Paraburkholderia sp. CNPSo 3157]|uniref:Uncharacterized protein n=1 Tax=Paraburkholderia franconis TaxID=2654983 RepID=A0A7X1NK00_9BURK|nr:hypothetical protein [Paraburkholderia franconis]MPW23375.1 hypothetical protein [Paraburkholderia franconis]
MAYLTELLFAAGIWNGIEDNDLDLKDLADPEEQFAAKAQQPVLLHHDAALLAPIQPISEVRDDFDAAKPASTQSFSKP